MHWFDKLVRMAVAAFEKYEQERKNAALGVIPEALPPRPPRKGKLISMGLFDIPDPVSIFESAKTAGLEREEINALVSAAYSAFISGLWRSGSAKWAIWTGEAQGMKDAATAMYLSLSQLESKNFLTLTVPQDLLNPDNLSKFQTQQNIK